MFDRFTISYTKRHNSACACVRVCECVCRHISAVLGAAFNQSVVFCVSASLKKTLSIHYVIIDYTNTEDLQSKSSPGRLIF